MKDLRARFQCLLIIPHPDQDNGLCKSLQTSDAAKLINDIRPDAMEHCPESEIRKLKSTKILDGGYIENLSLVEFSDPKRIEEIGAKLGHGGKSRASYIKLSATDLDALRLALHDPATRLMLGFVPQPTHARIRCIEINGSGFLGNFRIAWNDDLNVVIGGRGAGKSANLETLRYALSVEPYSEQPYRNDLVKYALGSGGKVEVTLERPIGNGNTRVYLVTRVWGEDPRVFELDSEKQVAIHPADLFGPIGTPTIFGQREIYAISGSEEYRLRLLDNLIGEEARDRASKVQEAIELLRANARSILDAKMRLAKREEHRQRIKTIKHEISIYEKHLVTEKLKSATTLRHDGQLLRTASETVERAKRSWIENRENTIAPLQNSIRNLRKGQSIKKSILEEAATSIENLERGLIEINKKGEELFELAVDEINRFNVRWQDALRPIEEELNLISAW